MLCAYHTTLNVSFFKSIINKSAIYLQQYKTLLVKKNKYADEIKYIQKLLLNSKRNYCSQRGNLWAVYSSWVNLSFDYNNVI